MSERKQNNESEVDTCKYQTVYEALVVLAIC